MNKINTLGAALVIDQNQIKKAFFLKIQPPSSVIVLRNLITEEEINIDEEFNDIKEDVKMEC